MDHGRAQKRLAGDLALQQCDLRDDIYLNLKKESRGERNLDCLSTYSLQDEEEIHLRYHQPKLQSQPSIYNIISLKYTLNKTA